MTEEIKNKRGYDKMLKRARERFDSEKTQAALREAIGSVPGITDEDTARTIEALKQYRDEFKHIEHPKQFRAQVVAWATRQAQLRVLLRNALPDDAFGEERIIGLYSRLPNYPGNTSDIVALRTWVFDILQAEEHGRKELGHLLRVHGPAVRRGIQKVLSHCRDLDSCITDVEDELFSIVWMEVAHDISNFIDFSNKMSIRLYWKAYWKSHAWKAKRLNEIKKGIFPKPVQPDDLGAVEEKMFYYATSGKLPPKPINLWRLGDEKEDGGVDQEPTAEPSLMGLSLHELWNPIVIRELRPIDADVERELRRAGPFRANDWVPKEDLPKAA